MGVTIVPQKNNQILADREEDLRTKLCSLGEQLGINLGNDKSTLDEALIAYNDRKNEVVQALGAINVPEEDIGKLTKRLGRLQSQILEGNRQFLIGDTDYVLLSEAFLNLERPLEAAKLRRAEIPRRPA